MSGTRTASQPPRLIYSLPVRPPIPFPAHPSYPVRLPTRDLPQAYLEALWTSSQPEQVSLEAFARLLLALRAQQSPEDLNILARSLILPLHDFDRRWRYSVPDTLGREEQLGSGAEAVTSAGDKGGLDEKETMLVFGAYAAWGAKEKSRLEEERAKKRDKAKGKEKAADQDAAEALNDEDEELCEVNLADWISDRELYETRLQALLLLTLLALPESSLAAAAPKKGRKKRDPERQSSTLDPALLLDFLTDRLQIWRVMKDVSFLDVTQSESQEGDKNKQQVLEQRDAVQEWWADVVEPLFRSHVDPSILSHHRAKLFPDAPPESSTAADAAEPYEARSLMSLEKSARRRELRENQAMMSESPTMKRLMAMSLPGKDGADKEKDVFKIPLPPKRRGSAIYAAASSTESAGTSLGNGLDPAASTSTACLRRPRKQERPRPLPRGDSSSSSMTDLLKRQLPPSSRSTETLTLVPDTPAKPPSSKHLLFRKPFSRAVSLPSFAALGAAFRPGAPNPSSLSLPFGIPPPPILPQDRHLGMDMDWETECSLGERGGPGSDEEAWLVSRREDWQNKGGHERKTSGSTEDEDVGGAGLMETPKARRIREVLVPDT
ncbi:hypothetical protein JCM1841_000958 [Sporobolomyces salmonicolor]